MATKAERAEALREANASSGGFVSGLNIDLGRINEEYVPALKSWPARMDLYQRMGNDAKIASMLRGNILPLMSAVKWKAEGGTDECRNLIAANMLRQGDPDLWCETSWTQRLFESLLSLQYGVSVFGKTREMVDGLMIFRSLTYLQPKSLGGPRGPWEWNAAGTRLIAVHRAYKNPDGSATFDERIPVQDLAFVTWWMAGDNWEGIPMIRSMYRAWVEKDLAQKIQMVDLQNRGVGVPMATLAPNDGKVEADTLKDIVKDQRGGSKERQFIVKGAEQKIEFLTTTGEVLDAGPIIASKNNEFASAAGEDFKQQGQTQSGSRATGSVLMVSAIQELDAVREMVQEQINQGCGYLPGPVEELQRVNFGKQEEYARIVGSPVSPTDQLDNVPNILGGIQKGALTHDLTLENYVRKAMRVPPLTADVFDKLKSEGQRVPNIGGRPSEVAPADVDDARDDDLSRVGLQEKKTLRDGTPRSLSGRCYVWAASRAS